MDRATGDKQNGEGTQQRERVTSVFKASHPCPLADDGGHRRLNGTMACREGAGQSDAANQMQSSLRGGRRGRGNTVLPEDI